MFPTMKIAISYNEAGIEYSKRNGDAKSWCCQGWRKWTKDAKKVFFLKKFANLITKEGSKTCQDMILVIIWVIESWYTIKIQWFLNLLTYYNNNDNNNYQRFIVGFRTILELSYNLLRNKDFLDRRSDHVMIHVSETIVQRNQYAANI